MKKMILWSSLMAAVVLFACDKDNDDDELNETDRTFMTQVAIGNMAEIQTGQLAATKGNNAAIKAFGQMMVAEHTLAQTELQTIASSENVTLPTTLDAEHQALMQVLNNLSGARFDSAYIGSQVADHQKTLTIFQTEISSGQHAQVRAYANKYLPNIQMHLHKADSLDKIY